MTGPQPHVAFDVIARNLADRVLAEVRASLVQVGQEAQKATAAGGRGVQGFDAVLTRMGISVKDAHRGTTLLRGGISAMALQAAGAAGPIGTMGKGLLSFGGPAGLAIAGTLGVIALATRHAGEEAKEAEKHYSKLAETIDAALRPQFAGTAEFAALARVGQARRAGSDLEAERAGETEKFHGLLPTAVAARFDERALTIANQLAEAEAKLADVRTNAARQAQGMAQKELDEQFPLAMKALQGIQVDVAGIKPPDLSVEARQFLQIQNEAFQQEVRDAMKAGFGTTDRMGDFAIAGVMDDIRARHVDDMRAAPEERQSAAARTASIALEHLAFSAITGGDALQALSRATSDLVTDALTKSVGGPLAGLLGGVAGGLLSLFGGGGDKDPAPVKIVDVSPKVVEDISKRITPTQVNQFIGDRSNAEAAAVAIRRKHRGRSDTLPRAGYPTGMS